MHETPIHQASGLDSLARAHSARLVAMVSHGDVQEELSLLWRLCLSWVKLGYPVTVLDASQEESDSNPGLRQLLDCPYDTHNSQESTGWSVLPAATGLNSLRPKFDDVSLLTQRLASLFDDDGVVVLYGSSDQVLSLLPDAPLTPVLAVSSAPKSLLTCYLTLKRLLSAAQWSPLVADVGAARSQGTLTSGATLAECARNFLQYDLKWVQLQSDHDDSAAASDLQRMALRILESALPLSGRWSHMVSAETKMGARHISRSH